MLFVEYQGDKPVIGFIKNQSALVSFRITQNFFLVELTFSAQTTLTFPQLASFHKVYQHQ